MQMFVNHHQGVLSKFTAGEFILPDLLRFGDKPSTYLLADDSRLRRSIKAMKTLLVGRNLNHIANLISSTEDGTLPEQMECLSADIYRKIEIYKMIKKEESIVNIFHAIQFWGGIAGRMIYIREGGFASNFNPKEYRTLAEACLQANLSNTFTIETITQTCNRMKFLGVAFGTKHAHFWSAKGDGTNLLIYDRFLSAGCLGFKYPTWDQYYYFVTQMHEHANQLGIAAQELERRCFIFFTSSEGEKWIKQRLNI